MALADLIKKSVSAEVATATPATVATLDGITGGAVAGVATVAVAEPLKSASSDHGLDPAARYTAADDMAANSPAEWTAKRPEIVGGGTGEKQILLAFAETAGGEIPANADFAKSCKCLILDARRPGRRKILRPLSVYEYRLAAEAGRRAVFCENHRKQLGGNCQHFDVIERLAHGDPAAALDACLLWRLILTGQTV